MLVCSPTTHWGESRCILCSYISVEIRLELHGVEKKEVFFCTSQVEVQWIERAHARAHSLKLMGCSQLPSPKLFLPLKDMWDYWLKIKLVATLVQPVSLIRSCCANREWRTEGGVTNVKVDLTAFQLKGIFTFHLPKREGMSIWLGTGFKI